MVESTSGDRGVMMPKRRYTRAHNKARAIAAERRLNQTPRARVDPANHQAPTPRSNGRNPPLRRGDGEEAPLAGHALELVSAAVVELES